MLPVLVEHLAVMVSATPIPDGNRMTEVSEQCAPLPIMAAVAETSDIGADRPTRKMDICTGRSLPHRRHLLLHLHPRERQQGQDERVWAKVVFLVTVIDKRGKMQEKETEAGGFREMGRILVQIVLLSDLRVGLLISPWHGAPATTEMNRRTLNEGRSCFADLRPILMPEKAEVMSASRGI